MIYITSFNKKLYESTGKNLVKTFLNNQANDELHLFTEDDIELPVDSRIVQHKIDDNKFLHSWLFENKDIIPKDLGGTFVCKCVVRGNHMTSHNADCPAGGMRRRSCHWFRKVTTLREAALLNIEQCVWIDCDSIFNRHLPSTIIKNYLSECCVRFHYGKQRHVNKMGIESGLVLYDMLNGAKDVIFDMCDNFTSGRFRQEKRWDDAWMLTVSVNNFGLLSMGDLCPNAHTTNVVNHGPFSMYIKHYKGIHWREFNINNHKGQ